MFVLDMENVLVLMSTYNSGDYLKEQIDSIFSQSNVNVHLLIRDDGSKNSTVDTIKSLMNKYRGITLIEGDNLGFANSFMSLVYEAYKLDDYQYFAFADHDDVWLPDKLEKAIEKLEVEDASIPLLYFSNANVVDSNLNYMRTLLGASDRTPDKYSVLMKYYMLGCTMVMNYSTISLLYKYRPNSQIQMHDLWIAQTCVYLGKVVYDTNSYILYRQHGNNAAGVGSSLRVRVKRFIKSFKTYPRRHFRELNAKNLLETYSYLLSSSDKSIISFIADYRCSMYNRLRLLKHKNFIMGSFLSDVMIKCRIIMGFL